MIAKVHRVEIDTENLDFLLRILNDYIIMTKAVNQHGTIQFTVGNLDRNRMFLGAATFIRDNLTDQTGYSPNGSSRLQ